jgi:hypothetical protein
MLVVAAASLIAAPVGAAVSTHGRNMNLGQVDDLKDTTGSLNWGGYVAATNLLAPAAEVTSVSASWIVQTAAPSSTATYSSQWTGIGGFFSNDDSLIQLGTESDYYQKTAHYYAWIEMLPSSESSLSTTNYQVKAGDKIVASISPGTGATSGTGSNPWVMKISDVGKWSYITTVNYASKKLSGEYIEERPEICSPFSCTLTTLANFGTADYGAFYTSQSGTNDLTVSGVNENLGSAQYENIIMYANNGRTEIALPSQLSDGTSFTMTYLSGSTGRSGVPQFGPERYGYNGNSGTVEGAPGPFDHRMH